MEKTGLKHYVKSRAHSTPDFIMMSGEFLLALGPIWCFSQARSWWRLPHEHSKLPRYRGAPLPVLSLIHNPPVLLYLLIYWPSLTLS